MSRKTLIFSAFVVGAMVLWSSLLPIETRADARAAEQDLARTVVLGLESREQNLQTLQGMGTAESLYEPRAFAALRSTDSMSSASQDLQYDCRGLQRVAFWLDLSSNRWRIEVAELMSTGFNEWGFLTNYATAEHDGAWAPVLVETCDGSQIIRWDIAFGRARTSQLDDMSEARSLCAKLKRYFILGWSDVNPGTLSLAGKERVCELDCYKLVRTTEGPQDMGKIALWVAPDKGFAPVRFAGLSVFRDEPKRGSRYETVATSFREAAPDVWFPWETRINSYAYVPESNGAMCETHVFRMSELQANVPIREFLFQGQIPLGTIVMNETGDATLIGHTQATLEYFKREPTIGQYDEVFLRSLSGDELEDAQ